jgi:type 1 glutamine amidotransferase
MLMTGYWHSSLRAQQKQISVLIVDGFSNHDWRQTTRLVSQLLSATGRFRVSVATTPSTAGDSAWAHWDPAFEKYDVVIQNTNNIQDTSLRWPRRIEARLEQYVKKGGGLYVLHSANNAFPHWKEYDRMIGLGWRPAQTGTALEIDTKGRPIRIPPGQGEATSHGERFDAVIHILHRHPVNDGYPEYWKTASMELYRYPRGPAENITILSAATDSTTHKTWPVEWLVSYGKGRIYNSSMGHLWKGDSYPISYQCAGFQTTLIRVTEWLATGRVTWPVPPDFPSATATSLRQNLPAPAQNQ